MTLIFDAGMTLPRKRGGQVLGEHPMERKEIRMRYKKKVTVARARNICVLDMETDPFDNQSKSKIAPFVVCLYSDQFEPIVIWDENRESFIKRMLAAIDALPGKFTIYAHNGGRFDFMFFVHELRGPVQFKGRGIMSAKIGRHELRDSFHIIPERLASYRKDKIDYSKMLKGKRNANRDEIVSYLIADCRYLFEIVRAFNDEFGFKISIGQAAMAELRTHYDVTKFSPGWDAYVRQYYFGGRVQCLRGRGDFVGAYKLYDVNSMYPAVMANRRHPVGGFFDYKLRSGPVGEDTVFVDLNCDNDNALIARDVDGATTATIKHGRFFTTIWEFETAIKYGLIKNIMINYCLDCANRTDFSKFILPLYERRKLTKAILGDLRGMENSPEYIKAKRDDIFIKLLLNNAYGKFAQNPANYKEHYLTDPDDAPPVEWFKSVERLPQDMRQAYKLPEFEAPNYWIWSKPNPGFRYNNVGTAASITGAARAVLLEALQNAREPIYCDTDSIICKSLTGVEIHKTALGAWAIEDEYTRVIINGKKLYSVQHAKPKIRTEDEIARGLVPEYTVKSKGVAGLSWGQMETILGGGVECVTSFAPTLTRYGKQDYIPRSISATAPKFED